MQIIFILLNPEDIVNHLIKIRSLIYSAHPIGGLNKMIINTDHIN
jgi:hypothetical protein